MEKNISIRQATESDIITIRDLAYQIWPDTYGKILSAEQLEFMLDLIYSPESIRLQMNSGQTFLLIFINEEAVGYAAYSIVADSIYKMNKLYVRPDIQGAGLGKKLLDAVVKAAQAGGAAALKLTVNRHNRAKSFYEKFGFEIIDEVDTDIGGGYFMNDFIMEKKLSPP